MNPFIYALKHDGVRSQLRRLIVCRKPSAVGDSTAAAAAAAAGRSGADGRTTTTVGRTQETRSTRTAAETPC